ncbi:MAG: sugar nucleotide-binding protein [Actinomycetota bacterium]|nr:sugar nucleotide-binding protein [Actinomycetota bacterium]
MGSAGRSRPPLELWAGPECTVNRVGDEYFDQLVLTGHDRRLADLDLFAGLGVSAVRYPVLWERVAREGVVRADWSWPDERLARLRELGLRPIVGLVHHGSGPESTSLVDPAFGENLAEYARAVADRHPWVEDWTPVNEPLTTARFSGLYGHWYPHSRDPLTFARCLLNECRAIVLAMRAIREAVPQARLVQTEDLGKTWATPSLAYQAEYENERRWLTFDLLCGRFDLEGVVGRWLRDAGVREDELVWFAENPCPPDLVGVNHYLSSERFLDERLERYPVESRGGNGRESYADVLAARVTAEGPAGPAALLRETWDRYGLPVAVTEAHNGCTREEQLRWLLEVWGGAERVRAEGADVRAVTLWSFFGAYGWDALATRRDGRYEPGVFDVRGPHPRPTALARLARELANGREPDLPAGDGPGWWRRAERLWYPPVAVDHGENGFRVRRATRPLVVTGATGTLGRAFARACEARGLPFRLLTRQDMDIADSASVAVALDEARPWAIVNTAGFVRVDEAEERRDACRRENVDGPSVLAAACARRGTGLLTFSSDLVFDGEKRAPYVESDPVRPLNVYGETKAAAERRVLPVHPAALVVRTSAFFGPWDEHNFLTLALRALAAGERFRAADDAVVSPTYVPDLVDAALDLLMDGESGIWHLANEGAVTWAELARRGACACDIASEALEPVPTAALALAAKRPAFSALGSERGVLLPALDDALSAYAESVSLTGT